MRPCERGGQREPVAVRQPDVDQQGIGREPRDGGDRRRRAVRLAGNGVAAPLQELARDLSEDRRVIDDEDAGRQSPIVGPRVPAVKRAGPSADNRA